MGSEYTYGDRREKQNQTPGNVIRQSSIQKKSATGITGPQQDMAAIVDRRSEAAAQRKMIDMIRNSPRAKQAAQMQAMIRNSPRQEAVRKNVEMIRNSPRAKQAAQMQAMMNHTSSVGAGLKPAPTDGMPNRTGLPDSLKNGLENLSGMSMDHVKVHYNSPKPAQLNAHAYTQGSDIHVAPGQEKHIAHEGWHVVQQAQGRVKPTMQMHGTQINDNAGLEREADVMGGKASSVERVVQRVESGDGKMGSLTGYDETKQSFPLSEFMVEDEQAPSDGQVLKYEFLAFLKEEVRQMADDVLSKIGQSSEDCPYISYWFNLYAGKSVADIEKSISRYAPGAMQAKDWQTCAVIVAERVRQGLQAHVDSGSLEGVPVEVPKDIHGSERNSKEVPAMTMSLAPIQLCSCCNREKGEERKKLLGTPPSFGSPVSSSSSSSSLVLYQPDFLSGQIRRGDSRNFSEWSSDGELHERYPIYYEVSLGRITVVAVTKDSDVSGNQRVVAESSLTYKIEDGVVMFNSFGSDPPFNGLGSKVLALLEGVAENRPIEPVSPVPGSYVFYHKKGYSGFTIQEGFEKTIPTDIKEQLDALGDQRKNLDNEGIIEKLKAIQVWVKNREGNLLLKRKILYQPPQKIINLISTHV